MSEFVITEAREAFRNGRTPFTESIRKVEQMAEKRAQAKLGGELESGGVVPNSGEWATITLRPRFFDQQGQSPGGTQLTSDFRQDTPASTGWANALAADLSSGGSNIGEDWVLGIAGFQFLEPTQRFSELRMRTPSGDKTMPVINVEDAKIYDNPAVLLRTQDDDDLKNFIFDQDNDFVLEANFTEATGQYYIKPIGVAKMPQSVAITQSP